MTKRRVPQVGRTDKRGAPETATPGMKAALAALNARKVPPSEHDAPPPSTFPGATPKPIPGQMKLGE